MKDQKVIYSIKRALVCISTLLLFTACFTVFVPLAWAIDLPEDTIVLEAEAGEMEDVIDVVDEDGVSGEGAIDSPVGAITTHEIQIPDGGKWYLWVRLWCPSGGADSYHFGMDDAAPFPDDGGQIKIFPQPGDSVNTDAHPLSMWVWDAGTSVGERSYFDVDGPGTYTFWTKGREAGTLLDQILLTMDDEFNAEEASQGAAIAVPVEAVYPGDKLAITWGEIRSTLSDSKHE